MLNKIIIARFNDKKLMLLIKIVYIKFFVIVVLMFLNKLLKIRIAF